MSARPVPSAAANDEADDAAVARALEAARAVRAHARAPYSGFAVGAAVVDEAGALHVGCNVESASFGLTLCAERAALAARVAAGGPAPRVVVVAIRTDGAEPTPPCGACRQWLAELAPTALVVAESADGRVARWSVAELLPEPFTARDLGERE